MADYLVQEDGTSKFVLEDASGDILLEQQTTVAPSFISSATTVYTPTVAALQVFPPFIASVTVVTAPIVSGPAPKFDPISEDFLGNPLEYEQGLGQGYDDFTLDEIPATDVRPSFIGSVTVVYTPATSPAELHPPFIGSITAVYAPALGNTGVPATFTTPGTNTWLCPPGITTVLVECYGGGGGGGAGTTKEADGGGGGAYANRTSMPVTPGTTYTFTVGSAGVGGSSSGDGTAGGDTTFTGDSGIQAIAKGGSGGLRGSLAGGGTAGGSGASSTGDTKFSGGAGGPGGNFSGPSGGGGASGNRLAIGAAGDGSGNGGVGANGGGSGGNGTGGTPTAGSTPGGGGGGGIATNGTGANGAPGQVALSVPSITVSFIASVTTVYTPTLAPHEEFPDFIASVTVVYTPTLSSLDVRPPFIDSQTRVYQPTLRVAFTGAGVSQVALEVLTSDSTADAYVSQVTLEIIVPWYDGLHIWEKTGQTGG